MVGAGPPDGPSADDALETGQPEEPSAGSKLGDDPAWFSDEDRRIIGLLREAYPRPKLRSVVYYLRKGDRIKIGYTDDLRTRMMVLRPDELLAVEPGSFQLETQRHHQFKSDNIVEKGHREWFRPSPDLTAHIASVAAEHGVPDLVKKSAVSGAPRVPEVSPARLVELVHRVRAWSAEQDRRGEDAAAELHRRGWTYDRIGVAIGRPASHAHRMVKHSNARPAGRRGPA